MLRRALDDYPIEPPDAPSLYRAKLDVLEEPAHNRAPVEAARTVKLY
jgi:hypothetical protein